MSAASGLVAPIRARRRRPHVSRSCHGTAPDACDTPATVLLRTPGASVGGRWLLSSGGPYGHLPECRRGSGPPHRRSPHHGQTSSSCARTHRRHCGLFAQRDPEPNAGSDSVRRAGVGSGGEPGPVVLLARGRPLPHGSTTPGTSSRGLSLARCHRQRSEQRDAASVVRCCSPRPDAASLAWRRLSRAAPSPCKVLVRRCGSRIPTSRPTPVSGTAVTRMMQQPFGSLHAHHTLPLIRG